MISKRGLLAPMLKKRRGNVGPSEVIIVIMALTGSVILASGVVLYGTTLFQGGAQQEAITVSGIKMWVHGTAGDGLAWGAFAVRNSGDKVLSVDRISVRGTDIPFEQWYADNNVTSIVIQQAIIIGIAAGTVCYGCVSFKNARRWDDALDVWGVHGMGGLTGAILTGTLASPHIWDTGDGIGAWTGTPEGYEQQAINIIGALMSVVYTFGMTILILKIMDVIWPGGIRVTPKEEEIGLDLAQHGERAYVNE